MRMKKRVIHFSHNCTCAKRNSQWASTYQRNLRCHHSMAARCLEYNGRHIQNKSKQYKCWKFWQEDKMYCVTKGLQNFNPEQAGGGGIRPQAGSSLCCAETVRSRKLKLSDFYYILIGLKSEYKPVSWDIHCCHGNAIVEGCSVKFWLKSVENCIFLLKSFSNLSLGLLFVISILKLPPIPNFKQIGLKTKKLGFSSFF